MTGSSSVPLLSCHSPDPVSIGPKTLRVPVSLEGLPVLPPSRAGLAAPADSALNNIEDSDDAVHGSDAANLFDGTSVAGQAIPAPGLGMSRLFGNATSKGSVSPKGGVPPMISASGAASPAGSIQKANVNEEMDSDDEERNPYIKGDVTPPPRTEAPDIRFIDFSQKTIRKPPFQGMHSSTPELRSKHGQGLPSRAFKLDSLWKSQNLRLSADMASATCCHADYGGFVTSESPLRRRAFGRFFEVRIEDLDITRWSDGFGIGIVHRPSPQSSVGGGKHGQSPHLRPEVVRRTRLGLDLPGGFDPARPFEAGVGYACEVMSESWMLGYDGRAKFRGISRYLRGESELPAGPWRPSELAVGDTVGLLVTPEAQLMLFVNGVLRVCVCVPELPGRSLLHAALDVDGCTRSIHLLDSNGEPSQVVLDEAKRVKQAHAPQMQAERWQSSVGSRREQSVRPAEWEGDLAVYQSQAQRRPRGKTHPQEGFESHLQSGTLDVYFRGVGFAFDPARQMKIKPVDAMITAKRGPLSGVATRRATSLGSQQNTRSSTTFKGRTKPASESDPFADIPSRRYPGLLAMLDS